MSSIDSPAAAYGIERRAEDVDHMKLGSGNAAWTWACLALVSIAVCAIYGRVLDAPLVFDDLIVVDNNPSITQIWPLVGDQQHPRALNPEKYTPTAGRPLVNLTFALNYYFGKADPFAYRCVNALIHILSAVLLATLVRRTLRLDYFAHRYDVVAGPLSLAVAVLWAVHPLHTETLAYITQRTELLMSLCYLATLYGALCYWTANTRGRRTTWLTSATVTCLAGMACKEVMVTAPVVVLLYERTFLAGSVRNALRRSWPLYVGLALGWGLLLALNYDGPRSLDAGFGLGVTAQAHWLTQTKVLLMYLQLVVWPWPLVIHYEIPHLETVATAWPWLVPVSIFAVGTLILLWRRSAVGFLLACVWLILSPTLVVPIVTEVAAERRMYLPLAAIITLFVVAGYRLVWYLYRWLCGDSEALRITAWSLRTTLVGVTGLVVLLCLVGVRRLNAYDDPLTLWSDALVHEPDDPMVHGNLGLALIDAQRAQEAVEHLQTALRLRPSADAHANLARAMLHVGRPDEAIKLYQWVIERQPENADAHSNLGIALVQAGRPQQAVERCAQAVRLKPESVEAQYNMGVALASAGRLGEAADSYRHALRLKPEYVAAHVNLGNILLAAGRTPEAIEHYEQAIKFRPDYADAYANLGAAELRVDRPSVAVVHLREAARRQPDVAETRYNLAMALAGSGQIQEAAQQFEAATKLKPDYAEAWADLATAHARQDRSADAIAAAEKSLELARAQGNALLVRQIEAWLKAYRAALGSGLSP